METYDTVLSVIVPVYNVENYLNECIDSILNQTFDNFEVICVDDGSTDKSGDILDAYIGIDSRIKVFHYENGGYGKAMNRGLEKVDGKYICIVEPDDYILPNMFANLVSTIEEYDVEFVKSNFRRFYGEPKKRTFEDVVITEKKSFYGRKICPAKEPYVICHTMNIWTGIYSSDFIKDNNIVFNETPGASFQDNGFWFRTYTLAKEIFYLDEFYYMNRRDNPNSSVKGTEKAFCVIEEFDFIENNLINDFGKDSLFYEYFVKCKLIAYVGAYNRSSFKHKSKFIWLASDDLKQHYEKGECNKSLYGSKQWEKLLKIVNTPEVFLAEDIENKVFTPSYNLDLYDKLARDRNDILKLESIKHNIAANTENIKISVIVPVYNVEAYIDECIESILNQNIKDIEVICIDDGSSDGSFEKILYWANMDSRVRVFCQPNQGSGKARNIGINNSLGKYIFFMDSDDWFPENDILNILYETAIKTGYYIVGGELSSYNNNRQIEGPSYYHFEREGEYSFSDYQLDYGYTRYLFSRNFLIDNSMLFPDYLRMQDPVFFLNTMVKANKFYAIQKVVYAYRKPNKKKEFNALQCRDILYAIKDEYEVSVANSFTILKESLIERAYEEFFPNYVKYIVANEPCVCDAFLELIRTIDEDEADKLLRKLFYWTSTELNIPLRKLRDNTNIKSNDKINRLEAKYKNAEREWKQARFEVDSIRASFSYKIGLFCTFIPRKIRSCLRKFLIINNNVG